MTAPAAYHTNWKDFRIRAIEKKDYSRVLKHLKENFFQDEPLNKWFGLSEGRMLDHDRRVSDIMSGNDKSLLAVHKDFPEKVAAVLVVLFNSLDSPLPDFTPACPTTSKFFHILDQIEGCFNIYESYGISSYPELAILSVDSQFRGFGLATELYKQAISNLFSEDTRIVPLICTEFSNPISRKIGKTLGFVEKGRFYFKDLKGLTPKQIEDLNVAGIQEEFATVAILERSPSTLKIIS